jgi:hypothetical protein
LVAEDERVSAGGKDERKMMCEMNGTDSKIRWTLEHCGPTNNESDDKNLEILVSCLDDHTLRVFSGASALVVGHRVAPRLVRVFAILLRHGLRRVPTRGQSRVLV